MLGHGLDVSQGVYNLVSIARQREAVNKLETALTTTAAPRPKQQATSPHKTTKGILRNTDRRARKEGERKTRAGKGLSGAGDRGRTGDVQLGKLAFYH